MPVLNLQRIVKSYGKINAVDDLSLEVRDGELLTLLGPSGCGKTTTLRIISGFVVPDRGEIHLGGRRITEIPPERRGIGLVFQNYALWPHMTVFQNLAFGLQLRKLDRKAIQGKVEQALAMVKLEGFGERFPRQLSGGQQQRVALARALVLEPEILLLDEPLSNLDALLREQMRFEIAQLHRNSGITTVYVTHDQTEAMVISDRVAVLNKGKIMQLGAPKEVYSQPADAFVAGFLGTTCFIPGTVAEVSGPLACLAAEPGLKIWGRAAGLSAGVRAQAVLRPESIEWLSGEAADRRNLYKARVVRASYLGDHFDYQVRIGAFEVRARSDLRLALAEGDEVDLRLDPQQISLIAV